MNEQRTKVFLDRYAKKDESGQPLETRPTEMFGRVALAMTQANESGQPDASEYNRFFNLLNDFKFVPGGRILAGAGTGTEVTFYNCYVIPVETRVRRKSRGTLGTGEGLDTGNDSREAIFDTIGLMVDIMSRGGGVGINWSVLRPSGAHLARVNGTSSGPVGWMNVASTAVGEVEQGGSRRGAAMFMLDDWHPDLLAFIDAKRDNSVILNANVSVAVSDAFMSAVDNDADWPFVFPETSHPAYDSEWDGDLDRWQGNGYPVKSYGMLPARLLWERLTAAAHASGEPGVVFLDRYNKQSTAAGVERLISVNPCGEQGLGAYSVCNLGAMNLDAYVVEREVDKSVGRWKAVEVNYADTATGRSFDYDSFRKDVASAVRFLDRAIDVNYYFLPENEDIQKKLRRIGLSVMGLADALIGLGIRYGSPEAVEFTEAVFRTMKDAAIEESVDLAAQFGAAPAWDPSMWDQPYLAEYRERTGKNYVAPLRNLFLLTQAPTGTTSILAGVNSGIEPLFAKSYTRTDRTGSWQVNAPALEKYLVQGAFFPDYVVTANDIPVEEHIAMQAAVQKYVDSSVSKTINAPNSQTVEETAKAYQLAYDSGLKGLAYYRDGSRNVQVLTHDTKDMPDEAELLVDAETTIDELREKVAVLEVALQDAEEYRVKAPTEYTRPVSLKGETHQVRTAAGHAYVTVNRDDKGDAREVFFNVGKAGSDITALAEALGRLASLSLRKGATLGGVANQLEDIGGKGNFNVPLAAALGKALSDINKSGPLQVFPYLTGYDPGVPGSDQTVIVVKHAQPGLSLFMGEPEGFSMPEQAIAPLAKSAEADLCPDCGSLALVREEGCSKCHVCGYSAC